MQVRINRNIVECKGLKLRYIRSSGVVLIETLWNVKKRNNPIAIMRMGINRNIVECKGFRLFVIRGVTFVLIETLWNVKTVISRALNKVAVTY